MSIFGEIAKGNIETGVGATIGAIASPFTSVFSNLKNIIIGLVLLAVVCIVGYMLWNYNHVVSEYRDVAITTAQGAAVNNAIDTQTVKESSDIVQKTVTENQEAKAETVEKEKVTTIRKNERIKRVEADFVRKSNAPTVTPVEKTALEKQRVVEISKVQISALWESYCEAMDGSDSLTLDQTVACKL